MKSELSRRKFLAAAAASGVAPQVTHASPNTERRSQESSQASIWHSPAMVGR
jgi:hypothetical protein